jgi:hypothetical protein
MHRDADADGRLERDRSGWGWRSGGSGRSSHDDDHLDVLSVLLR